MKNFFQKYWFIITFLILQCVVRNFMILFALWSPYDVMSIPEGLLSGNLAFDILNGTWRGWEHYLFHTSGHLGNEIMIGLVALPLFYVFGASSFVLHLIPTIWIMLVTVLLYYFARTEISERSARIAVALFACLPFAVQSWCLVPCCIHVESALFSLGAFTLFAKIQRSHNRRNRIILASILGLVCGFGIFHSETMLLACAVIGLFWAFRQPKFFRTAEFWLCLLCFGIGFMPYLFFGFEHFLGFIRSYFNYRYAWNHAQTRELFSWTSTLGVMSTWFWPISFLLLGKATDVVVTVIALISGFIVFIATLKRFISSYVVLMLCFYCGGYALVLLKSRVSMDYYGYPPIAQWMLVWAICIDFMLERFKPRAERAKWVYAVLGLVCLASVVHIFSFANFTNIKEQFSQQFVSRGYCFYWPRSYAAYPSYKTKMGKQIEWEATIEEIYNIHSHGERPDGQLKTFFLSMAWEVSAKLESEEDYARYGMDVSFLGFNKLSRDIADNVADEYKNMAYASMAVFYANDFLWVDIVPMLKEGAIEKSIPEKYRHWFYEELGRKVKEKNNALAYFDSFVQKLPLPSEVALQSMRKGFDEAEYYAEVPQRKS